MSYVYSPNMGAHYYKPAAGSGYHVPKYGRTPRGGNRKPKLASPNQYTWISRSLNERVVPESVMARATAMLDEPDLSYAAASAMLDELFSLPRQPKVKPVREHKPIPFVAVGHYAVLRDNVHDTLDFYRIDRPPYGTYAGMTFVKRMKADGRPDCNVRGAEARSVLEAIAADPHGAADLYRLRLDRCSTCNRKSCKHLDGVI